MHRGNAAAFWRCMNTAEAEDEADDPGALAAVGCLRAISTILESVSRLPHLFVQIEPTLLPIMRRMLTTDGQGTSPHAALSLVTQSLSYIFLPCHFVMCFCPSSFH
ncbi:hypothetical protein V8G54_019286 [Vigna mungo]|uniref:Uncharacterized protein n=1 Tax=Vigna mungo TaxID=3915 RepID=A0AAQ3N9P9_VIGMU